MKQAITQYLMVILLVVGAYFLGVYKTKTEYLEKGVANTVAQDPNAGQPVPQPIDMKKIETLFADKDNMVLGSRDAKIKFVEFSDTSCPFCHVAGGHNPELSTQMNPRFTPVSDGGTYVPPVLEIKKLIDEGKAALLWLYTPGHGNGELGTLALYCANEQGKFWEAHDKLMNNEGYALVNDKVKNDRSKTGDVSSFLKGVLDSNKLKSCMDSKKYEARVAGDPQIASSFGYGATPTFFINDKVVEGAASWTDSFKPIVDPLL
ncbi:DsbA family protein [Candidatus Woesebacteria bacterium]|nr:DsbA family protein [Candidatus Woesebacteria bacterium]